MLRTNNINIFKIDDDEHNFISNVKKEVSPHDKVDFNVLYDPKKDFRWYAEFLRANGVKNITTIGETTSNCQSLMALFGQVTNPESVNSIRFTHIDNLRPGYSSYMAEAMMSLSDIASIFHFGESDLSINYQLLNNWFNLKGISDYLKLQHIIMFLIVQAFTNFNIQLVRLPGFNQLIHISVEGALLRESESYIGVGDNDFYRNNVVYTLLDIIGHLRGCLEFAIYHHNMWISEDEDMNVKDFAHKYPEHNVFNKVVADLDPQEVRVFTDYLIEVLDFLDDEYREYLDDLSLSVWTECDLKAKSYHYYP